MSNNAKNYLLERLGYGVDFDREKLDSIYDQYVNGNISDFKKEIAEGGVALLASFVEYTLDELNLGSRDVAKMMNIITR